MKTSNNNQKELLLEVQKDGCRRLIYLTESVEGSPLIVEESNLVDYSRPFYGNDDFNVFFTERAFWKSFTEFTSKEGFSNRQVWHQTLNEWLTLEPVFIHTDIKHLVQQSLAEATREISLNDTARIDGIRMWLRALAQSTSSFDKSVANPLETYRHAV